jgi:prepilin peptidase CpaA
MNLIIGAPWWLNALLALVLCAAAIEDAVRLRISNATCLAAIILALVAMAIHGFPPALWQNAVVFLLILVVGTAAFSARMLGGGDVKLLAALGLWVNFNGAVGLVTAVFLAGGVLAILFILTRPIRRRVSGSAEKPAHARIPYGLAIAAGAGLVFGAQLGAIEAKPEKANPLAFRPLNR